MSLLSKLLGTGAKEVAGVVTDTAKAAADIVERWAPSDAAKHQMMMDVMAKVNEAVANARAYDPRSTATGRVAELINVLVDGINRLVRPGVTLGLFGGIAGWWQLPRVGDIDPVILDASYTVLIFWFGGRALFKDLPALLQYLKSMK